MIFRLRPGAEAQILCQCKLLIAAAGKAAEQLLRPLGDPGREPPLQLGSGRIECFLRQLCGSINVFQLPDLVIHGFQLRPNGRILPQGLGSSLVLPQFELQLPQFKPCIIQLRFGFGGGLGQRIRIFGGICGYTHGLQIGGMALGAQHISPGIAQRIPCSNGFLPVLQCFFKGSALCKLSELLVQLRHALTVILLCCLITGKFCLIALAQLGIGFCLSHPAVGASLGISVIQRKDQVVHFLAPEKQYSHQGYSGKKNAAAYSSKQK